MKREHYTETLKAAHMKSTPARFALLEVLHQSHNPLTVEALSKELKNLGADTTTLYRNLHTFESAGLVRHIAVQRGRESYELIREDDDHHHLICVSCNRVEDFHGCDAEHISKLALKNSKNFARVQSHSFELYGLCKQCAKKTADPPKKQSKKR